MNRSRLEHIIRAASAISGDDQIVVIGSQSIHGSSALENEYAALAPTAMTLACIGSMQ